MFRCLSNIWFRVCGFFVAFVGGIFGAGNSAQANHIRISDYATSFDMNDCDFSRPDDFADCYRNADDSICTTKTVTLSDGTVYPYFCLLDWARENRDALIDEIMTDVYGDEWTGRLKSGETQTYTCGTTVYENSSGVEYYYCPADKAEWETVINAECDLASSATPFSAFDIAYSTSSGDVVLHEYGACYAGMFRIIGCANSAHCLSSGRAGMVVDVLNRYACGSSFCSSGSATIEPSCPNDLNDWGLVPIIYSQQKDMCYVKAWQTVDDEGNGNLYDATGRFMYTNTTGCICFENDTLYCS